MIPSDNLQILYKTEIIFLGKNLQYLHQLRQQQFAHVAKNYPKQKMQTSCPEQQFASFGKEVILQKNHPQQEIQIVQNKEAIVNREVKVNKEAKDNDIKEAEDKLNMGTEKEKNGEQVKLSDLKENTEKIHKVDDTNGVRHRPTRASL